ncbi:MAG: ribonuclease H-like domain-containing protein [Holosporaceae bacterium]|jgi:ribonuclease D|nr:ribonuclease H-like domain-containing protein [Holosporaceae bacterium]
MKRFLIVCIATVFVCYFGGEFAAMNLSEKFTLYQNDLPSRVTFRNSVAVDTETMGLVIKRDRLCLVQLCSEDGEVHMVQIQKNQQHRAENLKRLLTDPSILKIFHFARFDVAILNYAFGIKVNPIYCTKIASKLTRTYSDRHGLKDLCREILGIDLSKQEQSSDWGREELSPEQQRYAAGDVVHLHKIKSKLDEMLIREDRMALAEKCFKIAEIFSDLQLADINPDELFTH